jgi:hypothetical protein
MAFRFYPRRNRAQKRRDATKSLSGLPSLSEEVLPRETVRRLSEFQGHHSEADRDLSDAVGVVTPSHKGID